MNLSASAWIKKLRLKPHPEGGWYRETYRAAQKVRPISRKLSSGTKDLRSASTAIYFLLEGNQISRIHRIASDELWHFYDGGPLVVVMFDKRGKRKEMRLGKNPQKGEALQAVVPAGRWFGAYVLKKNSFALVGCTVAPGFEFSDLEFAPPVRGRTLR